MIDLIGMCTYVCVLFGEALTLCDGDSWLGLLTLTEHIVIKSSIITQRKL